ncbi:hypothetical protein B296_00010974 [Ensete ventricosum]|uniref:Uncharacterized protein n=1 Tax=Ensete ventricosum TaxID=4639 RepID=A0A427ACG0_ENSVE|nr:hypothetical protein B296_00010974 [Ensete ventricosum]
MFQGLTSKDTVKGDQTHPKKPATHIIGRNGKSMDTEDSDDRNPTALTGQVGDHANANPSMNPIASAIPVQNVSIIGSVHHPFPAFTHFTHFQSSQDAYRSFLNISSTSSSLIVSTLLQNQAVHAAASVAAASLWPSAEAETSLQSTAEFVAGEIPGRHMNPTPSLEEIAAVTVAAAAAWWAAQGLLPWFPPLVGFAFAPPNTTTIPSTDTAQLQGHVGTFGSPLKENQKVGNQNQVEDLKPCHHSSKSL